MAATALNAHDPAMPKCWCYCSNDLQDQLPGGSKETTSTAPCPNVRGTSWHNYASVLVLLKSPGSSYLQDGKGHRGRDK